MAAFLASLPRRVEALPAILLVAMVPTPVDGGVTGNLDEPGDTLDSPEDLLMAVARRRDRSAFARLFDLFAPRLKGYLMRLGASDGTAEDVVQDVMLTVWRRAHTYDPAKAGAATWLFTVARNRRIDLIRRERRPVIDAADPTLAPTAEPSADVALDTRRLEARLRDAMADLPAEQARLLRLSFRGDMSHGAIAAALGVPLGTVKSRIRLAMRRLRTTLESEP